MRSEQEIRDKIKAMDDRINNMSSIAKQHGNHLDIMDDIAILEWVLGERDKLE